MVVIVYGIACVLFVVLGFAHLNNRLYYGAGYCEHMVQVAGHPPSRISVKCDTLTKEVVQRVVQEQSVAQKTAPR